MENIFIIPIFEVENDEYSFNGTGFIVNDMLFSAAHVFGKNENDKKFYFKYKDDYIQLGQPIHREYYADENIDLPYKGKSIHHDLIIFQVEITGSPYKFFTDEYSWKEKLFFCGYSEKPERKRVSTDECMVSIHNEAFYFPQNFPEEKKVLLENCLEIRLITGADTFNYPLTGGNSGCPIIDSNYNIYGLFLGYTERGNNNQYKALKSTYLSDISNTPPKKSETHFSTSGFLRDPSYSFYIHEILKEFNDKFGNAETITLNLEEVHSDRKREPFKFSSDGKKVEILITYQIYINSKGKRNPPPTPASVFKTVKYVLQRAVKEYNEQFMNI